MHDDPFTLTRQFGARVVEVDGLGTSAVYLRDYKIALIDASLDEAQRSLADGWIFQTAIGLVRRP